MFEREAQVLQQIQHPAISRFREAFTDGTGPGRCLYLVQDYVEGQSLAAKIAGYRYNEIEVLEIIDQLLVILAWLHERRPPIIHRDIKPSNVIRRSDGRLLLIDFGSVRDVVLEEWQATTVAGTFGYMAPEQFRGHAEPGTDIYALGVMAVELLTYN